MFYLTTHSTPFIYGYMSSDIWQSTTHIVREETRCCNMGYSFQLAARVFMRERDNFLFNDALNTFYLQLYGVGHMIKDHSDSERGNALQPHGLLFPISSKGFYMQYPIDRITHTTAFVTPVVEHWLEREIAQWVYTRSRIQYLLAHWSMT